MFGCTRVYNPAIWRGKLRMHRYWKASTCIVRYGTVISRCFNLECWGHAFWQNIHEMMALIIVKVLEEICNTIIVLAGFVFKCINLIGHDWIITFRWAFQFLPKAERISMQFVILFNCVSLIFAVGAVWPILLLSMFGTISRHTSIIWQQTPSERWGDPIFLYLSSWLIREKTLFNRGKGIHKKNLTTYMSIRIIEPHKKDHDVLLLIIRVHLMNSSTRTLTIGAVWSAIAEFFLKWFQLGEIVADGKLILI